jgi:hypothetical protein
VSLILKDVGKVRAWASGAVAAGRARLFDDSLRVLVWDVLNCRIGCSAID